MIPPPLSSPVPPDPGPEGDSHEQMLSLHDYRARMKAWQERMDREKEDERRQAEEDKAVKRLWKIAGALGTVVIGTAAALSWGQSKLDAGVAPIHAELAEHKKSEAETNEKTQVRLGELEVHVSRSEGMMEMLVRNRGMRPPPKADGGE